MTDIIKSIENFFGFGDDESTATENKPKAKTTTKKSPKKATASKSTTATMANTVKTDSKASTKTGIILWQY